MARHEQFTVGELLWIGVSNGAVTVLARDASDNVLMCKGTSAPSAASGYAVGCLFINTTTGIHAHNTGTTTSCSFVVSTSPSTSPSVSPSSSPSAS